jgi:hypothetical protein
MALIIGGHMRSGTTLLRNLCNGHPDITVTMEFGCFNGLGKPYAVYARQLLRRCWRRKNQSFLVQGKEETHWRHVLRSYAFVARYFLAVRRSRHEEIDAPAVEAALQRAFSTSRVVGDKVAQYVFSLDELAQQDNLVRVIIYRDCRDVTHSVLNRVRSQWRDRQFTEDWNTAEKIATHWIRAIEEMERHAETLHIMRYEDLIREPALTLGTLGRVLGVDPAGFPTEMIHAASVGKHASGLAAEDLATVMDIAGPTMARLGYAG